MRREVPEEQVPVGGLRPALLQVVEDRLAYDWRQRIDRHVVGLAFAHVQPLALPVEVIEGQAGDLAGAQPVCDEQQQDGVVPPADRRAAIDRLEHAPDLVPAIDRGSSAKR